MTDPAANATAAGDRLIGVVSFGNGCGQEGDPGVYTNVAYLHDWIQSVADSYPRPCETPTNITFAAASSDAAWVGRAWKNIKLTATTGPDAVAACQDLCKAAVDTSGAQKGCLAFAVTTNPRGAKVCSMWRKTMPYRTCGSDVKGALCKRQSDGAYRLVFGYSS